MEIVTYVLSGALEHKDSMGNGEVLKPGEFQRMSAGTGILHSEFNPSSTQPVHLYQIWLLPGEKGVEPSYEQKRFADAEKQNRWRVVASADGREGSLTINQDAQVYLALLESGKTLNYALEPGRSAWLQVLRGGVRLGSSDLVAGDGVALSDEKSLAVEATEASELMLFDLA
jgi:redox-sensitive bicupin YhaK (pirin superfamily)